MEIANLLLKTILAAAAAAKIQLTLILSGSDGNNLADSIINHVWKNLADNGINMN